ncbi:hypothetical protein [Candidatus Frankia nodulisporulans]|uniref:hypothetical protein n=1 Tax=Candidatus Frankia nodulisporulans TaxID=2060052 RepID=UPI0030B803C2
MLTTVWPTGEPKAAMAAVASASRGRPVTHGPHWPALWAASSATMRAVLARPQVCAGSTVRMPGPGAASQAASPAREKTVPARADAGSQVPP